MDLVERVYVATLIGRASEVGRMLAGLWRSLSDK